MNDLARIEPAMVWLNDHWPDLSQSPHAEEWMIRFLQALLVVAMVTVCIVVVMGIVLWISVWFVLSILQLITGR